MMMAKESVRARLEDRDQGISYTEFSYMLIQAYDFLSLYDRYSCTAADRAAATSGATSRRGSTWCGVCAARRSTG